MTDRVNSPQHYCLMPGIEVYDVRHAILRKTSGVSPSNIDDWSRSWEYLTRMWLKDNNIEDAKKAQWYLARLIARLEANVDE